MTLGYRGILLATGSALALTGAVAAPAAAQTATEAARDVIVVTATKQPGGVRVQDAPLAITAYGEDQLNAMHLTDLEDLSYSAPNVQLNDIGTVRGTANFSIRGIGINSSIPSIDPTVGVFVDGMYLGQNAGVVLDTFDLEGIEVLRGPQGLLFGRNVTGGAVLVRTRRPNTDAFEVDGRFAVETGLNYYAMGSVTGPLNDAGTAAARLSVYYNNDEGWHENLFDGSNHGAAETWLLRPSFYWAPNDTFDTILRYEHGDSEGDGPASQNNAIHDRNSFNFSIDEPGFYDSQWDQLIWESNWNVGFGDGTITNILGWRDYEATSLSDIDGLPLFLFHAPASNRSEQVSNEIRYSGTFGDVVDVTTGLYYFNQDTEYVEVRNIFSTAAGSIISVGGGGIQDQTTWGLFSQLGIHFTDTLTGIVGFRHTYEEKTVSINSLSLPASCTIATGCDFTLPTTFHDTEDWENMSGKLGFQWQPTDDFQLYGHWTSGFRSGGYNFRNSPSFIAIPGIGTGPGPTEPERTDTFEIGFKTDTWNDRARFNVAIFQTQIEDMQRELNLPGPLGVAQFIRNSADATLTGFELESQFFLTDNFLLTLQAGYVNGEYDRVLIDLSCNGVIVSAGPPLVLDPSCNGVGPEDLALDIPRVSPWTYGASVAYDLPLGDRGTISTIASFNHRDAAAYTDNNFGVLNAIDNIDGSVAYTPDSGSWTASLYGRNLLDEVTHGNDTQLPASLGGPGASFSPLNRGRVVGVELRFNYGG